MSAILLYVKKYMWLTVLALVTLLVYLVSDMVIQVSAQLNPSVKTVVIEKRSERKDVVIRREVVYLDGRTHTTEVIIDRTVTESDSKNSTEQKPMLAQGSAGVWTAYIGAARDPGTTYYIGAVNYKMGRLNIQAQVDNPAVHAVGAGQPAPIYPRAAALVGWSF